jgi:FkbM family methyltransferase
MKAKLVRLPNTLAVYGLSRPDTMLMYREIFEEHAYCRHGIEVRDGDCVFDVGANIGLFTVYLNRLCRPARVLAFEPVPAVYEVLRRNVELHGCGNVVPLNVGLGRQTGETTFVYYPRMSCTSTMYPDESAEEARRGRDFVLKEFRRQVWPLRLALSACLPPVRSFLAERVRRFYRRGRPTVCPLTTLSEVIRTHDVGRIDLLKIDVERSEADVLAGLAVEDWPRVRQLVVEVHEHEPAARRFGDGLVARGFRVALESAGQDSRFLLYATRPDG